MHNSSLRQVKVVKFESYARNYDHSADMPTRKEKLKYVHQFLFVTFYQISTFFIPTRCTAHLNNCTLHFFAAS